ncbi:proline-specific peptidase [Coprinellus micaceus]|uniref:Proline-specific peptidase n=1 Tax=Coprinellus micaceus TaxID=71717 RepID=A0A4Y7THI9_COPMI|nr:proline-specific peptidase [Coprinellus micaceus]
MATSEGTKEGYVGFEVPYLSRTCQTYYKIIGTLHHGVPPLIAIAGGPSCGSEYFEILSDVTEGRPKTLVLYDQLGSGRSTHLPETLGDTVLWTVQLFLDELHNLHEKLGIDKYDLLGHSWGGTIATSYAVQRPPGLRNLIIFSSQPSTQLLMEGHAEIRSILPREIREALDKYEEDGRATPEYRKGREYYTMHHMCMIVPMPPPIVMAFAWASKDPTVSLTMFGKGMFKVTGPMKDWSVVDQLSKIQVPTLVLNGAQDSARNFSVAPFVDRIPNVKWVKFENSSHMAHFEERERFMQTNKYT